MRRPVLLVCPGSFSRAQASILNLEQSGAGCGASEFSRPTPYAATQIRLSGAGNLEHTRMRPEFARRPIRRHVRRSFNEGRTLYARCTASSSRSAAQVLQDTNAPGFAYLRPAPKISRICRAICRAIFRRARPYHTTQIPLSVARICRIRNAAVMVLPRLIRWVARGQLQHAAA